MDHGWIVNKYKMLQIQCFVIFNMIAKTIEINVFLFQANLHYNNSVQYFTWLVYIGRWDVAIIQGVVSLSTDFKSCSIHWNYEILFIWKFNLYGNKNTTFLFWLSYYIKFNSFSLRFAVHLHPKYQGLKQEIFWSRAGHF